ncbi:hypothetical protein SDC9_66181 [bioreactor metagenome]|uniref:Uncharacterized protein n=1 Tax=bioreactor metagenome TaxID=1076179 RepID=A0A644XUC1_9ZZZZ
MGVCAQEIRQVTFYEGTSPDLEVLGIERVGHLGERKAIGFQAVLVDGNLDEGVLTAVDGG